MPAKKLFALALVFASALAANAQKTKRSFKTTPPPAIFAVESGGRSLQLIATVKNGTLTAGDDDLKEFANRYYKPMTSYRLIFGGADAGTVKVSSSNHARECAGNSAVSITNSKTAKLSDAVMAIATNAPLKLVGTGVRRRPSATERAELEKLVRAEFAKQKVGTAALKVLKYQNLTALDINNDGTPEFVGSYWVSASENERDLLYFIAQKQSTGGYKFGYSDFAKVTPDETMSGDVTDMDTGIGHELLLDVLDYDGDGTAEIFTIKRAYEGDNFYVYKLGDAGWKRVFETYNYRCAF